MRFFLNDRIREMIPGDKAVGVKCWSMDNEIFQDHFPGLPTTPGVLLTESMAQLSGVLIKKSYYKEYGTATNVYPVLSIIQKAKFRSFVRPGDQCIINAQLNPHLTPNKPYLNPGASLVWGGMPQGIPWTPTKP